jgi:hypothetical protein
MNARSALFSIVALLLATPAIAEDPAAYPEGKSIQTHAGLKFHLEIPTEFDPKLEYSLIVGLHGMDALHTEFGTWWEPLVGKDFIVCCPKSTGINWNKPDVEKVKEIVRHLMKRYRIGKGRLHGVGFSNGGQHLAFLVMDPKLPFATACWMGSGFGGGKVPKRARKEMAAIALCGEKDPARGAAERTPKALKGKVRYAEVLLQPDLAHEIPDELMEYYYHWLTVMEGRFEPGEDAWFDWIYGMDPALDAMKEDRRGGFVYFYSYDDETNANAKRFEHEVLFDPLVRRFGKLLVPVMLSIETKGEKADEDSDRARFLKMGFETTPAVAVLDREGKVTATFEGAIDAKALAKAMSKVAPRKR